MRNLAIITTPLQLLNLNEYLSLYPLDIEIIAFIKRDNTKNQITSISKVLNIKIEKTLFINNGLHFFTLRRLINKIHDVNILIIGQLFSDPLLFVANNLNYSELVILDDGLANIHAKKAIEDKIPIVNPHWVKQLIKTIVRVNVRFPDKATLFTIFDLKESEKLKIIKNEFFYTKKLIGTKSVSDEILIIGQPFVENGEISSVNYQKIISLIEIDKADKLIYLAHRREIDENLTEISKTCMLEIQKPELNFELFLAMRDKLPKQIIGFTSTALITAKMLTKESGNVSIESKRIPNEVIEVNQDKIASCYYEITNHHISIDEIQF